MPIELKVPAVGESITEVQIGAWLKREGEWADKDQPLVEIESDKATVELPAPQAGQVTRILKQTGDAAAVGEVIGLLDERAAPAQAGGDGKQAAAGSETPRAAAPAPAPPAATQSGPQPKSPSFVMPAAEHMLAELGLNPAAMEATGPGGRLLKEDVVRHVARGSENRAVRPGGDEPAAPRASAAPAAPPRAAVRPAAEEEVVPMSPLRRRVAERLVEAQQTAALLTTFNEIDMSAVIELRQKYRDSFAQKHGVKLGFMSFFVKAAIEALKQVPQVNAEVRGSDVVYHNNYDIGVAVGGGKGLVVPVVRSADRLSYAEIEQTIEDFARRARENKIKLEELQGGTFTISNGGIYGSLLSTPIINPPQSGILGMHAIQERPVARGGQVVIRPMMYVALTYDHRLVDGREAVLFLRHVKELIEEPSRMLLEL